MTLSRALWAGHAVDACLYAYALGAALNLATAQGSLLLLLGALVLLLLSNDASARTAWSTRRAELGPALFFLGACALSIAATTAPFPGWFDATRFRPLLGIPLAGLAFMARDRKVALRCAALFAGGCALHALIGLYQARTGATPLADLLQIPPDKRTWPAPDSPGLLSAAGLFYNRVRLSHVLASACGVAAGMALFHGRRRAGWLLAAAVSFAGLLATYGRAALAALLVSLLLAAAWRARALPAAGKRALWRTVGAGAVGVILVVAAVPSVRDRMASAVDVSRNADRLFLWARGVEMALDHAPFGTGFGGYAVVRDAYYDRVDPTLQSRAMSHNQLLTLLAETGVAGLVGWLWMWLALFLGALRRGEPVALAGALGALTFHAATLAHDPLYQSECALAWGFCAALMLAGGGKRDDAVPGTL
ncbi:MAG: O-antigen ligase family protein [Deltaproteobacteria bacterium]|nr:O-antigen ligase family protein [Deltaproteobacteria bacterium]